MHIDKIEKRIKFYFLLILLLLSYSTLTFAQDGVVGGKKGMVATAHPLASQAALHILQMGGNAVDAAVAAAFTIGVVEPDGSGLGGGGGMVIYMNNNKSAHYINYYQQASEALDKLNYNRDTDRHTVKSVLIPGTVAGLTSALKKFGTLPLKTVMAPAIQAAEQGFEIDATLAKIILDNVEVLLIDSLTSSIYLEEGFPKMQGDSLWQPELGKTLRVIARAGRDGFYSGEIARRIVYKIQAAGGVLTENDFKNYTADVTTPLVGEYRGYKVLSANVPQSGVTIIESLNMLENVDLKTMGHFSKSAKTLHLMAETFRRSYADRWAFVGDPRFGKVATKALLSKAYARERFLDINPLKAVPDKYRKTKAGNPGAFGFRSEKLKRFMNRQMGTNLVLADNQSEQEFDGGHTTHLSVIDSQGNAVALTQTLGTFFGSGQTVAGVLLNCGMSNFSKTSLINKAKPNMRPRSSISPTIVLKAGSPFMVVGSPGAGRIIATVVEVIVNAIDFGMDARQINDAPRFYCQKWDDYLHLEFGIMPQVQSELTAMGHNIQSYATKDLFFGGVQLILVDPKSGLYYGSADPRRGGQALGY